MQKTSKAGDWLCRYCEDTDRKSVAVIGESFTVRDCRVDLCT